MTGTKNHTPRLWRGVLEVDDDGITEDGFCTERPADFEKRFRARQLKKEISNDNGN